MPMKAEGEPDLQEAQRWEGGVSWLAYPEEGMQRASHALAVDDAVWVVDPVDAPDLDDLLAAFGDVAGVVVGLDRHTRDAAAIATRHDVPVYLPDWMSGVEEDLDAPVERFGRELADTGIRAITVRDAALPPWQESALYRESDGTLIVPEALGTAPYYVVGDERLGVHPMLRLFPPRDAFGSLAPERILTGHGKGIAEDATDVLDDALEGARRRTPRLYLKTIRMLLD